MKVVIEIAKKGEIKWKKNVQYVEECLIFGKKEDAAKDVAEKYVIVVLFFYR
jgi:hypothetical protein